MSWKSLLAAGGDLLPGSHGPVPVCIPCTNDRDGERRWHLHDIVIDAGWTVTTPHDLEAERIATAFGSYVSCLDLESKVLPAVRRVLERVLRRRPPEIARRGPSWTVKKPMACCRRTTFATVREAAEHLRSAEHASQEFDAELRIVEPILRACVVAHGGREHRSVPGGAYLPLPRVLAVEGVVQEEFGIAELWDAGVHPEWVARLHADIGIAVPLPAAFYLGSVVNRPDLQWLSNSIATLHRQTPGADDTNDVSMWSARPTSNPVQQGLPPLSASRFTPAGVTNEPLVSWLAWTWTAADKRSSEPRADWLALGIPRRTVVDLVMSPYSIADIRALGSVTGASTSMAAEVVASWWARGWQPHPDDLGLLVALGLHISSVPAAKAVESFVRTVVAGGAEPPEATESALLVAACGSARMAAHAWLHGDPQWRRPGWDQPVGTNPPPHCQQGSASRA